MSKQQSGFTLIELVIVIVILGLLAATALPRFIGVTSSARTASVQGVGGGLSSAASLAKAQWLVNGSSGATSIVMDGVTVQVNTSGYPTNATNGIDAAMQGGVAGFTPVHSSPTSTYQPNNGGNATCETQYNSNTGAVTTSTGGC